MRDFIAFSYRLTLLPVALRPWLPLVVPLIELACVGLLLAPGTRHIGLRVAIGVLIVFTSFLIWKAAVGLPVYCQCFGGITFSMNQGQQDFLSVARNTTFLAIGALGIWFYRKSSLTESRPHAA